MRTIGGHADMCYVGDIDWKNPGVEIFYGRGESAKGTGLMDGKSGKWLCSDDNFSIDGQGLCGDLFLEHAGYECWGKNESSKFQEAAGRCYTADGKAISHSIPGHSGGVASLSAFWEGTECESIVGVETPGGKLWGTLVADIMGDLREEIIVGNGSSI